MNIIPTELPGVVILEPRRFRDNRGFFFESYSEDSYAKAGLPSRFVQDNVSFSGPGVLRGLHYQLTDQLQGPRILSHKWRVRPLSLH